MIRYIEKSILKTLILYDTDAIGIAYI